MNEVINTFRLDTSTLNRIGLLIVLFIALIVVSFLAGYLTNRLLRRWLRTGAMFLAGAVQTAILIGGLYQIALYSGMDPVVILAMIAIASAGVSLAADNAFANFLSGMLLVLNKRFSVDDQVTIGDLTGVVKQISLFAVTLQVNTRGIVVLPNRLVAESTIINHTELRGVELVLSLPFYDAHDIGKATNVIRQAVTGHDGIQEKFKILHAWNAGVEQYAVIVRVNDYAKRREVLSELSIRITEALRKEDLPLGSVSFFKNI